MCYTCTHTIYLSTHICAHALFWRTHKHDALLLLPHAPLPFQIQITGKMMIYGVPSPPKISSKERERERESEREMERGEERAHPETREHMCVRSGMVTGGKKSRVDRREGAGASVEWDGNRETDWGRETGSLSLSVSDDSVPLPLPHPLSLSLSGSPPSFPPRSNLPFDPPTPVCASRTEDATSVSFSRGGSPVVRR